MAATGSSTTHDRRSRAGEERGYVRLTWRALLFWAFAAIGAIAVLATGSPAQAEDSGSGAAAQCAEATVSVDDEDVKLGNYQTQCPDQTAELVPGAEGGLAGERPALQEVRTGDRPALAQVERIVVPTVGKILRLADVDPESDPATGDPGTLSLEESSGAVDPATLPDANRSDEVEPVVPSTTTELVTELVDDVAHAPSGIASRLDDTTRLIDRGLLPADAPVAAHAPSGIASRLDDTTRLIDRGLLPADAPVAAQAHDLAQVTHAITGVLLPADAPVAAQAHDLALTQVTHTITGLLPALDLDDILAPVLTELDGTLAAPLNLVTAPLDTLLVPLLGPTVKQAGDALNPAGTDLSDGLTSPADNVLPALVLPALVPGSTIAGSGSARSLPLQDRLATQLPALDFLEGAAQPTGEVAAQTSDATAPVPGPSQPAGAGGHGSAGASGGSAADSGKFMIDAFKIPSASGQIGDRADSWRLPGSIGSAPGYSPA